jgi:sugar phosphate isomerase/epimerase
MQSSQLLALPDKKYAIHNGEFSMSKPKIGLIGILGDEYSRDFWAAAKRVAEIGYQGLEGMNYLLKGNVEENLARFHQLGLKVISIPASREQLRDGLDEIIAGAKALQAPYVACYWGPAESREQLLADAKLYNEAGAKIAASGLKLLYHNHEHEFKASFNGVYALDILAEYTAPENLSFMIDVAWVTFGGEDPVRVLRRYAGRVPVIHVKDLYGLEERNLFTAVGTGVVKVRESLLAAAEIGVEWAVIEQDTLRNLSAYDTAAISYMFLKEQELVA